MQQTHLLAAVFTVVVMSVADLPTSAIAAASDDGAISLRTVLPARGLAERSNTVETPHWETSQRETHVAKLPPVGRTRPLTVPPVPGLDELPGARPNDFVRPRDILLTAGQDEAATVMIPELRPPAGSVGLQEVGPNVTITGQVGPSVGPCQCQKCVSARRGRRSRKAGGKFKSKAKRALNCFVEECDDVHCEVDNYRMPILLVGASDEDQKEQTEEDPAVHLLSRKLTDIQPTLAYAYGEDDKRLLPEAFYESVDHGVYRERVGPKMVLQWEPTNLWYYPLYFEDTGLERYGHTHKPWVQPFVSTGKFFGQVVGLPYKMTLDPPHCPQYALGHYQPGECAPKKKYQVPWNEEAAATQFLWMTGLFLLIP